MASNRRIKVVTQKTKHPDTIGQRLPSGRTLDLSGSNMPLWRVTLRDGTKLKVKPAPRWLAQRIQNLDEAQNLEELYNLAAAIMGNNTDGRDIGALEDYDIYQIGEIIRGYSTFLADIQQSPN